MSWGGTCRTELRATQTATLFPEKEKKKGHSEVMPKEHRKSAAGRVAALLFFLMFLERSCGRCFVVRPDPWTAEIPKDGVFFGGRSVGFWKEKEC